MRQNTSGLPMYFDHQNKVVMLDRPSGLRGIKREGKMEGLRETGEARHPIGGGEGMGKWEEGGEGGMKR